MEKSSRHAVPSSIALRSVCAVSFLALSFYVPPLSAENLDAGRDLHIEAAPRVVVIEAPLKVEPRPLTLGGADPRVVLDLPGIEALGPRVLELPGSPLIRRVRIGRHPEGARVVIDLRGELREPFRVARSGDRITVTFPGSEPASAPNGRELPAPPEPSTSPAPLAPVTPPAPETQPVMEAELQFSVSALAVSFAHGAPPKQDLVVKNRSKGPLFMTATADVIENPGSASEVRKPTPDLLVSPRRFEIPEGGERRIRLVLAHPPGAGAEQVYRVNLVPDAQPFEEQSQDASRATAGLSILAVAEPEHPAARLGSTWTATTLALQNRGNIALYLDEGRLCARSSCTPLPARRLYPGGRWEIAAQGADSAEFLRSAGQDFEHVVIRRAK